MSSRGGFSYNHERTGRPAYADDSQRNGYGRPEQSHSGRFRDGGPPQNDFEGSRSGRLNAPSYGGRDRQDNAPSFGGAPRSVRNDEPERMSRARPEGQFGRSGRAYDDEPSQPRSNYQNGGGYDADNRGSRSVRGVSDDGAFRGTGRGTSVAGRQSDAQYNDRRFEQRGEYSDRRLTSRNEGYPDQRYGGSGRMDDQRGMGRAAPEPSYDRSSGGRGGFSSGRGGYESNQSSYGGFAGQHQGGRGGGYNEGYSREQGQVYGGRDRDHGFGGRGGYGNARDQDHGSFGGRGGYNGNTERDQGSFGGRGFDREQGRGGYSRGMDREQSSFSGRGSYGNQTQDSFGGRGGFGGGMDRDGRGGASFGGTSGRGGTTMSSSRGFSGDDGVNDRYNTVGNSKYGGFSNTGGGFDFPEGSRADRFYKPEERTVADIINDDKDVEADLNDDADIEVLGVPEPIICEDWAEMKLHPTLLKNITASYVRPRKVQMYTIPLVLDDYDCKVQCETGSGKTAAFLVPMVNDIIEKLDSGVVLPSMSPVAIVIGPTRELVNQLYEQAQKFTSGTPVKVARCYGQYNMRDNLNDLRAGCHILCACLGRLMHFVKEGSVMLSAVSYIVLDEADRLLNENSQQEVLELMTARNLTKKEHRQTLLFSATLDDPAVSHFCNQNLRRDKVVTIKAKAKSNRRVSYVIRAVPDITAKHFGIVAYLREITTDKGIPRVLVFVNKKVDTDRVATALSIEGFSATTIHGDRGQDLREKALKEFRTGKSRILVATDVCARGVDIKALDYVINFDLPNEESTFVQRSGRTGRTHNGVAVSFYNEYMDKGLSESIIRTMAESDQESPQFLHDGAKESDYAWCTPAASVPEPVAENDEEETKDEAEVGAGETSPVINDPDADDGWN